MAATDIHPLRLFFVFVSAFCIYKNKNMCYNMYSSV